MNLSLVISMMFFALAAQANEITIGKKSYPAASAVGFKSEDYYSIVIGDSTSAADVVTAFVLYIPNENFKNGTYDLVSLVQNVDSVDEAVNSCNQEESEASEITLPDSSKIYLVGSSTKIKQQGKFFKGKGISIADKSFKGAQITISGIGESEASPIIENVNFLIEKTKLPVVKINYKVLVSDDCEELAKKSKFKASKKAKKAKISVDVNATVVTSVIPTGF